MEWCPVDAKDCPTFKLLENKVIEAADGIYEFYYKEDVNGPTEI